MNDVRFEIPSSSSATRLSYRPRETDAERCESILIYRTGQLGDTLVSLPAIRAIKDAYPDHRLILLTDRQSNKGFVSAWDVLGATNMFSEVFFYTPPTGKLGEWFYLLGLVRLIRKQRPEAVFCLRDPHWNRSWRDRLFFQLACGIGNYHAMPSRTNYIFGRRDQSGALIRYPREANYLLDVVSKAGVHVPEIDERAFALPLSKMERARIDSLWHEHKVPKDSIIVGLAPGSKMPAKRWPLERFIEVGRSVLGTSRDVRIVTFGGAEDRAPGEAIRQALGDRVINLAGELTLLESAEALRRCSVYVGNDTGTMHLAAASGTPCVVIFSARDHPGRWDPFGKHHVLLRTDPPCAGCLLETCIEQDMKCLKDIGVSAVVDAVKNIIKGN
jgi:heptosyltransferase-3